METEKSEHRRRNVAELFEQLIFIILTLFSCFSSKKYKR